MVKKNLLWRGCLGFALSGSTLLSSQVLLAGTVTATNASSATMVSSTSASPTVSTAAPTGSAATTAPTSSASATSPTQSAVAAQKAATKQVSPPLPNPVPAYTTVQQPQSMQPVFLPPLPGLSSAPPMESDAQSFSQTVVPSTGFALTPKQIEELHAIQLESAMASNKMPLVHGKSIVLPVSMAPGSVPPPIHLALGYMTVINFVGSEGNPWPVRYFEIGNSMQVSVQSPDQMGGGNGKAPGSLPGGPEKVSANGSASLWLFPMKPDASTNLAVLLKGSHTPLICRVRDPWPNLRFFFRVRTKRRSVLNWKMPCRESLPKGLFLYKCLGLLMRKHGAWGTLCTSVLAVLWSALGGIAKGPPMVIRHTRCHLRQTCWFPKPDAL